MQQQDKQSFPVNSSTHGTVTSTSQVFYNGILLKEGTGVMVIIQLIQELTL